MVFQFSHLPSFLVVDFDFAYPTSHIKSSCHATQMLLLISGVFLPIAAKLLLFIGFFFQSGTKSNAATDAVDP